MQTKLRSYLNGLEIKICCCFLIVRLHAVPSVDTEFLLVELISASFTSAKKRQEKKQKKETSKILEFSL